MAYVTYTVKQGDTLSEIALKFGTTVSELARINQIPNPEYIVVGQVLVISGDPISTANNSNRAILQAFGLQSNTDRTVYAKWNWSKENTENYQVRWWYSTGDATGFIGSDTTTEFTHATYTAPENAVYVTFFVKPISKKHTVNDKEVEYWTAEWSTAERYFFKDNPPSVPDVPKVEIKDLTLTASLDNLDVNGTSIQFQIYRDHTTLYKTGSSTITNGHASFSCKVAAGSEYKVRCRAFRGNISGSSSGYFYGGKYKEVSKTYINNIVYGDWTEYSDSVGTPPEAVSDITTIRAASETSVYLEWSPSKTATKYDIEYATKVEYFDGSDKTTTINDVEFTHYEKTGLESGTEYFFRVRAKNDNGESAWTKPKSCVIGKDPAAPTTWSSTTTAIVGEPLILYWVHNSEDGSSQTYAELEITVAGTTETYTIKNSTDEEEKDKTSFYSFNTSEYPEGTKIQWRVRTAGVTKAYGDWSIQREVDIYAPPTLELTVNDVNGNALETLTTFPVYVSALAGPNTQAPIGYHLVVTSNQSYETVNNIGNVQMISAGDQVYSKYFDTSDPLTVELSASNINLDNNIAYTITCIVSMNSGLTAESSVNFVVAWTDEDYWPNAEIAVDDVTCAAYIRPYCLDIDGNPINDLLMSVYRREFDGGFTEIQTGIDQTKNTFVTDPHPSLDYARYRIVATSKSTGAVSFYDMPGYPVGCVAAIIQWDEAWTSFDTTNEDALEMPPWTGTLLRLPYNIDVSDKAKTDVSLVEYIGRENPVSYYGTQIGSSSSWSMDIPKDDKETLYAIRRLARWMGDVYVREPSGSGYWANVNVSYNQKHCETTIPITLDVTRVEGGI